MEINDLGQMKEDVALAGKKMNRDRNIPVYAFYQGEFFNGEEVKEYFYRLLRGEVAPEL